MEPQRRTVLYRPARKADAGGVAWLHGDSWRRNYRGAYADDYLDGDVLLERRAVWSERLAEPRPECQTVVAEADGQIVGFVHTIFDADPQWGALLENLHVVHDRKGSGVGTRLMAESAAAVLSTPHPTGLFLWVLEQNTAAQAFYDARGGVCVGGELRGPFPGGGRARGLRYVWPDPRRLHPDP
jgi:ribosomal protein S18 acetylase RimI-like enzyme